MSPARHFTHAQQTAIRRRHEQRFAFASPVPIPVVQVDVETVYPFPESFYDALNAILQEGATTNIGPTRCSRLNYLWFATSAMAYQWTQPITEPRITGTKDKWDWSNGTPLATNKDQYIWMNHMWEATMPFFVPSYSATSMLSKERVTLNLSVEQQASEWSRIQEAGDWAGFWTAWQAWWLLRQADGSAECLVPPLEEALPNGPVALNAEDVTNPETFLQPLKWTPLQIGSTTQQYLTYTWMSVRSTVLSGEDATYAQKAAKSTFLIDPVAKAAEISEILDISQTLTDAQKVSAEFWAGGPNTVSPPGMMLWFWRTFMQVSNIPFTRGWSTLVYSGLDLAAHIFETSRLVWGLKKYYMEARPIQYIRMQHRGTAIVKYDGTATVGEAWVPYQEPDFISPPFADFPSGHSAFSQSFANVMTDWFGPTIPSTAPTTLTDLALLSPSFKGEQQIQVFGSFTFPQGASLIQPSVVPAAPLTFTYTTWQELSDDAGISRKYGGIHATSAHVGSVALANALHQRMIMRWGIPK